MFSKQSLARSTIIKMGIRIAIITIIVTLVSYWHIMSNLELQVVEQLNKYIVERGYRESNLFKRIESNHAVFKEEYLARYSNKDLQKELTKFNQLYERADDGGIRLHSKYYYGTKDDNGVVTKNMSGVIGNKQTITPELLHRIVKGYELVSEYGPAWKDISPNLYFMTHEDDGSITIYWPGNTWGVKAPPDIDPTTEFFEVYDMVELPKNPNRETVWSGVYYDSVAKDWMVSCVSPIEVDGKHIGSVGTDVLLNNLFTRVIEEHLEGAYNFIFMEDGRLIAHPFKKGEIQEKHGLFNIIDSNDHNLIHIYEHVKNPDSQTNLIDNETDDEYIAVTKIEGPDWYFVTVYPKSLLADLAFDTAGFILLLGIISLFIEVTILLLILRRQVARPLQDLLDATKQIAAGNFNIEATQHLPLIRRDEIGELAHSFNSMASQLQTSFDTLEEKVTERTYELGERVKELNCLYSVSNLAEEMGISLEEILQGTLEIIPPSWQYPQMTGAKIVVDGQEFQTANFQNTAWFQNRNIVIKGQKIGSVEVCYLEEKPESDEGPFLQEEKNLINAISIQLGRIIENKQASEALAKRTQELSAALDHLKTTQSKLVESEKMASLGGLVAGVAHEINTPIGIGVTAASTLVDRTAETTTAYDNKQLKGSALKAYFNMAQVSSNLVLNNLNRAAELIQSFKQVAVEQSNFSSRSFAVKKYIKDTLLNLKPHLKKTPHQITVNGDEQISINSYPGAFSQIITNLVMNSVRHAYPKGEAGNLRFELKLDSGRLMVEYSDDGCGIPPENREKIFEPFFTTARAQGGTGLGLHIVFNLVTQKLQGTINVQSEVGVGTTFILNLPLQINNKK